MHLRAESLLDPKAAPDGLGSLRAGSLTGLGARAGEGKKPRATQDKPHAPLS